MDNLVIKKNLYLYIILLKIQIIKKLNPFLTIHDLYLSFHQTILFNFYQLVFFVMFLFSLFLSYFQIYF
jgi:hypothetical protein